MLNEFGIFLSKKIQSRAFVIHLYEDKEKAKQMVTEDWLEVGTNFQL